MHILLTGLNHETSTLETREKVSFTQDQIPEALALLSDHVGEGIILSTCNRTEIYAVVQDPQKAAGEIHQFLADFHSLDQSKLDPNLYDLFNQDAISHLFKVSSGLDSMILGEYQILGQVRMALTAAALSRTLSPLLSRLFHRAIRTGRKVREETDIGKNSISMSYAGVQLARRIMGNLAGLKVLLVGAGQAGQLIAQALDTTGATNLVIANRTQKRSKELARSLGGTTICLSEISQSLPITDIVIVATEAPDYLLTETDIAQSIGKRQNRPLFIFDMSVPRNVDPKAGLINKVNLFNIDDLSSVASDNLKCREDAAKMANKIVDDETNLFIDWWGSLEVVPFIRDLHGRAELIRKRELARAILHLPSLSPEDTKTLDAMTRSIIARLLHDPTVSLKQNADKKTLEIARDLFRLWDDRTLDNKEAYK